MKELCVIATVLMLLFMSFSLSVAAIESKPQTSDNYPAVSVYPNEIINMAVGETFSISVVVSDIESFYGFDIRLKWDPAIIEYVNHTVMAPVENYEGGVLHSPIYLVKDEVNLDAGTYWVAYASMSPADPFNGDGVFFIMTFKVLTSFEEKPYELVETNLSDDKGQPIAANEQSNIRLVIKDDVWEFIHTREKDPKTDGWNRWWRTQMWRKWGF